MRKSLIVAILSMFFSLFFACSPIDSSNTGIVQNTDTESVTENGSEDIAESSDTGSEEETKVYNYECKLTFFVNPRLDGDASESVYEESQYVVYGAYGQHVMDAMVRLLSSDIFAEEVAKGMETETNINCFVSYSYYTDDSTALAGSYIYIKVVVPEETGIEFTEKLVDTLQVKVSEFVEKNMPVPTGYDGTECMLEKCEEIRKKEK